MELQSVSNSNSEHSNAIHQVKEKKVKEVKTSSDASLLNIKVGSCTYIIFLDMGLLYGGVLGEDWEKRRIELFGVKSKYTKDEDEATYVDLFNKNTVSNLHWLIDELSEKKQSKNWKAAFKKKKEVGIVLSGMGWRGKTVEQLRESFQKYDFSKHIVGNLTCETRYGDEDSYRTFKLDSIKKWLIDNKWMDKEYAVLDDDEELINVFCRRFVDTSKEDYFTREQAIKVLEILKPKQKRK